MDKLLDFMAPTIAFWQRRSTAGKIGIAFVALLLFAASRGSLVNLGLVERPAARPQVAPSPAAEPFDLKAPSSYVVVRGYLRQTLNDWDSYEDMGYSEPEIIEHKGRNAYHVLHRYRAKNQFGAFRLVEQDFYYTHDGEIVDVSEPR